MSRVPWGWVVFGLGAGWLWGTASGLAVLGGPGLALAAGLLALGLALPVLGGLRGRRSWRRAWPRAGALTLLAAALPAAVAYGGQGARPSPAYAGLALTYALLQGPAWALGRVARGRGRAALTLLAGLALAAVLLAGPYFYGLGLLPFPRGSRWDAYQRLWANLERFYAYWDQAPVTPADLKARYADPVRAADAACRGRPGPCEPYRQALRAMLAELQDGHTRFEPNAPLVHPRVAVRRIEGQAVIVWVAEDSDAAAQGLKPGMVIRAVDGAPVAEALERVPPEWTAFAAAHTREEYAYRHLLAGPPGTQVTLTVADADGTPRTVTLTREPWTGPSDWQPVEGRRLDDGWGYIAVRTLSTGQVVPAFDRLLDDLADAPGLILDLRNNGGGNSLWGDRMVARLLTEPVTYGRECFRAPHPLHFWSTGCHDLRVEPRGPAYAGPVAVLINTGVHSSAEWMTAALCTTGRARCFGRPTAGNTGNPVLFFVPDGQVRFSTGRFYLPDGNLLNGRGIWPHETVAWTIEDVRTGHDPDLAAARAWLATQTK